MTMTDLLRGRLRLPVICSPLFIISGPELVIAQCKAGIIGSFPALNARPPEMLDDWLAQINEELAAHDARHPDRPAAPFAVNQVVNKMSTRLDSDMEICEKHKVPLIITSLGAREDVNQAVHRWGGQVYHDVTTNFYAHKAIDKGADGLIAVAAGAGGHASDVSPFALMQEIRAWWDGPLALSGCISTGRSILAAEAMGADFAYIGSAFIAAAEANAVEDYKQMIVDSEAKDIMMTDLFTGHPGNYLRPSIERAGLDPEQLHLETKETLEWTLNHKKVKRWKDVWGAGQGIGAVDAVRPVEAIVDRWVDDYDKAKSGLMRESSMLRSVA
ncbi:nitronate monooxygenase [Pseudooceanicola sediminis]|uniref:Nitronate monooxygenase n=1 Tax=Pseudooceanicola sediminis TaxID=2211117 RepID=A0A399J7A2_9RHOB|nr:nitronate monooxygenase family protein [Pseudooceanicola sediminis]KAA2313817.1 nitronate monooxygenase [Puniceibacterium sp. HSS470]RII38636.1 nitronate monooxygenase [Pseudooceanicola sediminis]|tara:strand:- start:9226 stop:10212 length:987 start_codon:yes stop_codon:yes gene_type:complete